LTPPKAAWKLLTVVWIERGEDVPPTSKITWDAAAGIVVSKPSRAAVPEVFRI
jgi:hypothetical protein